MPPKRKVKAEKMDARKTREPVSNHTTPTPPTKDETAATQVMNEALEEVLMSPPTTEAPDLAPSASPPHTTASPPTTNAHPESTD